MKTSFFISALFGALSLSSVSYANDFCQTAIDDINTAYQKYTDYENNIDDDGSQLSALIKKTLSDKQSLNCDWSELKDFNVEKSPDGRLLSLDWRIDGGGTMHVYDTVLQYHNGNYLNVISGDGGYVLDIDQMTLNNQPVYFINDWEAGYTSLHGQTLSLFTLKNNQLIPANMIKTKKGLTNKIDFIYNPFSIPDDIEELIQINAKKKEFTIPVVIENEQYHNGEVTKRVLRYRHNGKHFVYVR